LNALFALFFDAKNGIVYKRNILEDGFAFVLNEEIDTW